MSRAWFVSLSLVVSFSFTLCLSLVVVLAGMISLPTFTYVYHKCASRAACGPRTYCTMRCFSSGVMLWQHLLTQCFHSTNSLPFLSILRIYESPILRHSTFSLSFKFLRSENTNFYIVYSRLPISCSTLYLSILIFQDASISFNATIVRFSRLIISCFE